VDDEIDAVKAVYLDDVISEGSDKDGSRWLKVRCEVFVQSLCCLGFTHNAKMQHP
jgi:hypothetical protein